MRTTHRAVLLAGFVLPGLLAAQSPGARLGEPSYLSPTARRALHLKMRSHAGDMRSLLDDVLLLRREQLRADARRIADEPRLARPMGTSGELNASLPERYFALQDALRDRAQDLARAARTQGDRKIAEAFSGLMQVCVECHAAYLRGPSSEQR